MEMPVSEMLSVTGIGIGTVFAGLICIIILCKIVSLCYKGSSKKAEPKKEVVITKETNEPIENRQEIIAAVSAAIAEELGTDISAIRILSFKKI